MKSKTTIYLLIAAVLVIWGVIAWKLFAPSRVETSIVPPSVPKAAVTSDRDTLLLNYPDPFLKKQSGASTYTTAPAKKKEPEPRLPKIREECQLRYIGHIRQGKVRSCIVESGGAHRSVAMGESVDGFRLAKIFPDSLVFTKDGFSYTIGLSR